VAAPRGVRARDRLRKSELARLKHEDIRKADRIAFIVSTRKRGRTKSRKMRPVVLSSRALEILDQLPRRLDGYVFGRIPDARRAFQTAAKAAGVGRLWLRSSGRMADRYTHARMERLRALVEGTVTDDAPRKARPSTSLDNN
jgi:integrase